MNHSNNGDLKVSAGGGNPVILTNLCFYFLKLIDSKG